MDGTDLRIKTNEVLLHADEKWLYFTQPYRWIAAQTLDEVLPALQDVERLVSTEHCYAAGFLSYESATAFDPAMPSKPLDGFPYLWLGLYPQPQEVVLPRPSPPQPRLNWHPNTSRGEYKAAIAKVKDHIAAGRTYQVNYTLRLETEFHSNPWDYFLHLAAQQNEHAAFVDVGRYVICSASPELFFRLDGQNLTCRPMKGTTRRGRTTSEDDERSTWLRHSKKNRAENVMIVDMIRNDLGRIAQIGTVCVPHLFETERYPSLWQMTSTVTARTQRPLTEILAALFPCASITGAPKVSTMQIIADIETTPRRVYTGSIGYIAPGRKASFNVAIRTVLLDRETDRAEYGVGGGIVWDSEHRDEYAEALLKAELLTRQHPDFALLETLLWTPGEGFFLGERHVARMLDSAAYFDIPVTVEQLQAYYQTISQGLATPQRVRILLDRTGALSFEATPLATQENTAGIKACLAKQAVDSGDVFLFHKTTRRDVYESARMGSEACDDILLYNERGELTEFTVGNLVVELDGRMLTPPIASGVLPGTFRSYLLETGQVREQILRVELLKDCSAVFRVNSVRKWQRADVVLDR